MSVYFIQSVNGGPIKIGSSIDPKQRLKQIQYMSPVPLEILGTCDLDESDIHSFFSDQRLYGEWFEPTKELLEFVKNPTGVPKKQSSDFYIERAPAFNLFIRFIDKVTTQKMDAADLCDNCGKRFGVIYTKTIDDEFELELTAATFCPNCGQELRGMR